MGERQRKPETLLTNCRTKQRKREDRAQMVLYPFVFIRVVVNRPASPPGKIGDIRFKNGRRAVVMVGPRGAEMLNNIN